MIPSPHQLLTTSDQRLLQLCSMLDRIPQRTRPQRMKPARSSIHHNQTLLGEYLRHQPPKRQRQRRPRTVFREITLPQPLTHRSKLQQLACPLQHRLQLGSRHHATHRHRMRNLQISLQRLHRTLRQQRNLIYLFQIMIFGGHPEHRNMLHTSSLRRLSGPSHRRSRLQQDQQRPAKQHHLLPRHHRPSASPQLGDIRLRGIPRAKLHRLLLQQISQRSGMLHRRRSHLTTSLQTAPPHTTAAPPHRRHYQPSQDSRVDPRHLRQHRDGKTLKAHADLSLISLAAALCSHAKQIFRASCWMPTT